MPKNCKFAKFFDDGVNSLCYACAMSIKKFDNYLSRNSLSEIANLHVHEVQADPTWIELHIDIGSDIFALKLRKLLSLGLA